MLYFNVTLLLPTLVLFVSLREVEPAILWSLPIPLSIVTAIYLLSIYGFFLFQLWPNSHSFDIPLLRTCQTKLASYLSRLSGLSCMSLNLLPSRFSSVLAGSGRQPQTSVLTLRTLRRRSTDDQIAYMCMWDTIRLSLTQIFYLLQNLDPSPVCFLFSCMQDHP
jgi:hypothetical protein